jgi:hypothetical protein
MAFSKVAKAFFKRGEVSSFFKAIQEGDDGLTVEKVNGRKFAFYGPGPHSRSNPFQSETKIADWRKVRVHVPDTVPIGRDQRREIGVSKQRVFHSKNGAPRYSRGSRQMKGDMVRGRSSG